jgi:hypothetical protein
LQITPCKNAHQQHSASNAGKIDENVTCQRTSVIDK